MEKEFIPYKEAVALKELGFDEDCFMTYLNGKLDKELFLFNHSIRSHSTQEFTSAPLYQQAFKFFREKYDLDVISKPHIGKTKKYICDPVNIRLEAKNTYEEAELACLKKLIEIVKNK
jgi:hypothetical protein